MAKAEEDNKVKWGKEKAKGRWRRVGKWMWRNRTMTTSTLPTTITKTYRIFSNLIRTLFTVSED